MANEIRPVVQNLDVSGEWQQFVAYVYQQVKRFGQAAATLAVRQYLTDRAHAGLTRNFRAIPAAPPNLDQVARTMGWATSIIDQPGGREQVPDRIITSTERMVLDAGRQTIVDNVQRDRKAKGWARITEPNPCAFCALLATRGAAYRSEQAAEFKTHDHCRCHAEPVFSAYEPSAQVREWQGLYRSATRGVHGMKAAQRAWRQAFESHQSA